MSRDSEPLGQLWRRAGESYFRSPFSLGIVPVVARDCPSQGCAGPSVSPTMHDIFQSFVVGAFPFFSSSPSPLPQFPLVPAGPTPKPAPPVVSPTMACARQSYVWPWVGERPPARFGPWRGPPFLLQIDSMTLCVTVFQWAMFCLPRAFLSAHAVLLLQLRCIFVSPGGS